MTIHELIERLQSEHGRNGAYYLLNTFYNDLCAAVQAQHASYNGGSIKDWLRGSNIVSEKYQTLFGFFYGLRATNYIDQTDVDDLITEMQKITRGKELTA